MDTLKLRADGLVGELVLDRPTKLNALSPQMLDELIEAAAQFDGEPDVKVVVLRGAGRAFTAGADLDTIGATGGNGDARRASLDRGRLAIEAIAKMRALTIAAIHGHCVGGGVVLAAACDLRIAAAGTTFAIPEVDLGIPLTWGGIPRLVRELGPAVTKELVLTCRAFDAAEALSLRFVNRVVEPKRLRGEAFAIADKLASQPAHALFVTKRQVDSVAEEASTARAYQETASLVEALHDEESQQAMARYLQLRR